MSGTTTPIEPTLPEGIDKALLIRLFAGAEAGSISAMADMALAQGQETAAAGAELESSQYEPLLEPEGGGDVPPPVTGPPGNVDVPHVQQAADTLSCTMGNWTGEPTSYAYAWQLDGADVGTDSATHTVTVDDVGKSATCTVTATNAEGSTAAPPSNSVVVAAAAGRDLPPVEGRLNQQQESDRL